jgi:hypothetical protein
MPHIPLANRHAHQLACTHGEQDFLEPPKHSWWLSGSNRISKIQLWLLRPSNCAGVCNSKGDDDLVAVRRRNRQR